MTKTDAAKGTTFAGNKGHIDSNNGTFYQLTSSLPDNALSLYAVDDQSAVTAVPWGKGQIIFLAWDWYDAKPDFGQNGGWLDLLASAVSRTDRAILGTSGDDVLDGGSLLVGQAAINFDDKVLGLRGNDTIDGWGGDDAIFGGPGADILYGGPGFDKLHGSRGNDTLSMSRTARKCGAARATIPSISAATTQASSRFPNRRRRDRPRLRTFFGIGCR